MDFLNLLGAMSGCASIVSFLALVIRLGEWKARHEERLASQGKRIDGIEIKQDSLSLLLNKNNEILTEIKVKVDLMHKEKNKRSKQ